MVASSSSASDGRPMQARWHAASRSSGGADRRAPAADPGCAPARAGVGLRPVPGWRPDRLRPARRAAHASDAAQSAACARSPVRRPTGARPPAGAGSRARRRAARRSSPSGLATPLATLARCLVRATPTVIGKPTFSRTSLPQLDGDLGWAARELLHAVDVEERLVDGQAFDELAWCCRRCRTRSCWRRSTR